MKNRMMGKRSKRIFTGLPSRTVFMQKRVEAQKD